MPQILRASPDDLFPPLGLDPMSPPPHGLPSPLIRTITETRHQHILWCLFPGFSRDPVDPPSHLSQCGLTSSFQRRGPGGADKDDGSPKNKEVEDRASRRHSQSPVATPPPRLLLFLTCLRQVGRPEGLCWAPVDALCNSCSWDWSLEERGLLGAESPGFNGSLPPQSQFATSWQRTQGPGPASLGPRRQAGAPLT